MRRREFLALGIGGVGAATAAGVYRYERAAKSKHPAEGTAYASSGGLLDLSVHMAFERIALDGYAAQLYTMNGSVPGPLIEAKAGDTVRLRLTNGLPEPTNLHYHGLHIPPTGSADNIFLAAPPGESLDYEFTIPRSHPAGLFWYHPHVHGASARQISYGLAAPFVVRGELDRVPEVAAASEYFLVLQEFGISNTGLVPEGSQMHGGLNAVTSVSGRFNPDFVIEQDGLARLRFLNASSGKYYRIRIEEHPMYLIATDGGGIPEPEGLEELTLLPGQRADVLIRGERGSGSFRLLCRAFDPGGMHGMGEVHGMGMGHKGRRRMGDLGQPIDEEGFRQIGSLLYTGRSTRAWNMPSRVVDVAALPVPSAPLRSFLLNGAGMHHGGSYSINGRRFDARRVDTTVSINTVEDWEYVNPTEASHPMHLHINAFQILDERGRPERAWRDLVDVPARASVRLRVRFADFPGKTVQHCHILEHEDRGMMATVEMSAK